MAVTQHIRNPARTSRLSLPGPCPVAAAPTERRREGSQGTCAAPPPPCRLGPRRPCPGCYQCCPRSRGRAQPLPQAAPPCSAPQLRAPSPSGMLLCLCSLNDKLSLFSPVVDGLGLEGLLTPRQALGEAHGSQIFPTEKVLAISLRIHRTAQL